MGEAARREHIARAAVDSIGHQICDIVDVIEQEAAPLRLFRADGGATASDLVVQTQADLLGREVQVGEVAEVSALGAARLAWAALGRDVSWPVAARRPDLRSRSGRGGAAAPSPALGRRGRAGRGTALASPGPAVAPQWREVEIAFTGPEVADPYLTVDAWVIFRHAGGQEVRRPVFWDGGTCYRVRFASPRPDGEWRWEVHTARPDHRLSPPEGRLTAVPPPGDHPHRALNRGLVSVHPGHRTFRYADGSPAFFVFDTAWAMPWRATVDDVEEYAADRQAKGFNAVLMMSVQPDMNARGPAGRNVDEGFEVGFARPARGAAHPDQRRLLPVSRRHRRGPGRPRDHAGLAAGVPRLRLEGARRGGPGRSARRVRAATAGISSPASAPGRRSTCRARTAPAPSRRSRRAAGRSTPGMRTVSPPASTTARTTATTSTRTPTGWTSSPARPGTWATTYRTGSPPCGRSDRPKAIMNGEPSYEHSGRRGVAEGWWQGHEAWCNVCAGALMGVAYGAAGLWQWRLHPDEPGHGEYFLGPGRRLAGGAGVRGQPLRRPGRQDPRRPADRRRDAVLGRLDQHPRPARPGRSLCGLCRARRSVGVPGRRRPGALAATG